MILSFDIDGVLADNPWTVSDWNAWVRDAFPDLIPHLKLRWPDCVASINSWSLEHQVEIVTSRPAAVHTRTRQWLQDVGFHYPNIHLCAHLGSSENKREWLQLSHRRYGDRWMHFDDDVCLWNEKGVVGIWTPSWNRGGVGSWEGVVEVVESKIYERNIMD